MKPQIDSLTGIRGVAALWVVLVHLHGMHWLGFENSGLLAIVAVRGWLGVDLFFILSGFVISYVHQFEFTTLRWNQCWQFYVLRFGRVYPAHFVTTVGLIPVVVTAGFYFHYSPLVDQFTLRKFGFSLALLNGWGLPVSLGWNMPSWSVSSECFAYLLFPSMAWLTIRLKGLKTNLLAIVAVFVCLFGLSLALYGGRKYMFNAELTLLRVSSEFFVGCLLYNVYKRTSCTLWFDAASCLCIAVVVVLLPIVRLWAFMDGVIIVMLAGVVFCLSRSRGYMKSLFANGLMVYLGRISYSMYLVHYPILMTANWTTKKYMYFNTGFGVSIRVVVYGILLVICAHMLYHWVEEPGRKFVRGRLLPVMSKPVAQASVV